MKIRTLYIAVAISLLASASAAQASYSWSMTGNQSSPITYGNERTFAGSDDNPSTIDPSVTASAWSNTGNNTTTINGTSRPQGPNTNSVDYTIQSAYLPIYGGGLGAMNRDASSSSYYGDKSDSSTSNGEHSVDNNQRNDMVLFKFDDPVNLQTVILGWSQYCADITVLAYLADPASLALDGLKYNTLAPDAYGNGGNGWAVVGHYANAASSSPITVTVNQNTQFSSSYWLIGAYNPTVGGTGLANGCDGSPTTTTYSTGGKCHGTFTQTSYNSANVKIAGLAGETAGNGGPPPQGVPEPGTLGLLGLGLLGLVKTRKRLSQAAA